MKKFFERFNAYFKDHKKSMIFSFLFIIVVYFITFSFLGRLSDSMVKEMSYPEFEQHLLNGEVDAVSYNNNMEYMTVILFNDETKEMTEKERRQVEHSKSDCYKVLFPGEKAVLPVKFDLDGEYHDVPFRQAMMEYHVIPAVVQSDTIFTSIFSLLITLSLYIGMFFVLMKFMGGSMRGLSMKDIMQTSDVTFDQIIGHEEIIDDVHFITELIKDPKKGDHIGAKLPKGILFTGPPGTGKTLLAKAIAHEAGVPFLYQNASGFIEMFVGLGAKRVRDLFKIARKNAPCIIFIDEIDAVGGNRESRKGTSENEQTVNALLQEMDGFSGRDGVFIIAATNRPESLDPALVRSGRFDRQIAVNPPRDWHVRKDMFVHYLSKLKSVDDNIDLDTIAKEVSGFTGADIAMVVNEASIIAVRQNKDCVDAAAIEEAIDKKLFDGNRAKRRPHDDDMKITAYHEAGHAVVHYLTGTAIARASIQPTTSGVGGAVIPQEKISNYARKCDVENMILAACAGRASEEIKFGADNITTGASNDIEKVTQLLENYAFILGFDRKDSGFINTNVLVQSNILDAATRDKRIVSLSNEMYDRCKKLLEDNYDMVEKLATALLESETLSGTQIEELLNEYKKKES